MSVLNQKLEHAANEFQSHNFQQALEGYNEALKFARSTDEPNYIIYNILSSKGAIESILGHYSQALDSLNTVIRSDPTHFLALVRRSQVYKKQKRLRKAEKDLNKIYVYCPDNLQVCAFRAQIENLILKSKDPVPSDDSSDEEEFDEEAELNFVNLKLIDRTSIKGISVTSITSKKNLMRKSRVSILGDQTVEYVRPDFDENIPTVKNIPIEEFDAKFAESQAQIEKDCMNDDQKTSMPDLNVKVLRESKKSILKNRNSMSFIREQTNQNRRSNYLGLENKLINKLKNIEGKVLKSIDAEKATGRITRQVQFRKSLFSGEDWSTPAKDVKPHAMSISYNKTDSNRKSCLKQPSFEAPKMEARSSGNPRRSKLQSIDIKHIDGVMMKKEKKIRGSLQADRCLENVQGSDSDGSQHDIFGSKELILTQEMQETLGFNAHSSESKPGQPKLDKSRSTGGKSILKKSSFSLLYMAGMSGKKTESTMLSKTENSAKKSVMFRAGQSMI